MTTSAETPLIWFTSLPNIDTASQHLCLKPSDPCQGIGVASPHQKYTTFQMSDAYVLILRAQVYAFTLTSDIEG